MKILETHQRKRNDNKAIKNGHNLVNNIHLVNLLIQRGLKNKLYLN